MPPRRNEEKFQQFMEFQRGTIIGLREGEFSYNAIGARVQRNSSTVMQAWKQWTDKHRIARKTDSGRRKQDSTLPYVVKTFRDFCAAHHMQLLPWAAYSPDMSPIEQVWDLVGRRLARDLRPAASKDELLLRIQAIRNSLPQAYIQNLFGSMPRRIAALIAARGGYTKY
ncbi:hypothetical protein TNCV_3854421 [Trichonephila clavipes]|nr:hypothetical protein TNCV_3854421 [Trichonephila clavipes]